MKKNIDVDDNPTFNLNNYTKEIEEPLVVVRYHKGKLLCLWFFIFGPSTLFFGYCLKRSIEDSSWILTIMGLLLVVSGIIAFLHQINIKDITLYRDRIVQRSNFFFKDSTVNLHRAIYTSSSQWLRKRMLIVNDGEPAGVVTLYPGIMSRTEKAKYFDELARLTGRTTEELTNAWNKKLVILQSQEESTDDK